MEDAVIVENLNDIAFPDGFVRTDGEEEITVVGKKTFTGVLCKHFHWFFLICELKFI